MGILEAIEDSVNSLSTRTRFVFVADLEEANATIFDRLKNGDFPVCMVWPLDIKDDRTQGSIKSTTEVNAFFLSRLDSQATIDKPLTEIESQIIAPMRRLAREFVNILDDNDIMQDNGITNPVYRSVHQAMSDAHLHGVWVVFTPTFNEGNSLCPPH